MEKDDIIPKGKYKGKKVSEILSKDPQFIIDMRDRLKMEFSDSVLEEAQNIVESQEYEEMDRDYELKRVFRNAE